MKTIKQRLHTLTLFMSLSLFAACGGDGVGGTGIQPDANIDNPISEGDGNEDTNNPLASSIEQVTIPFREHGYSNFETLVFNTQTEFDDFISDVSDQGAWNNKTSFLQKIQAITVDFTKENLLLYRITETSGSNVLTPQSPVLNNDMVTIIINRQVPQIGTADIAYYALAYKVNKSISKVIFDNGTSKISVDLSDTPNITVQGKLVRSNETDLLAYFQRAIKRSNIKNTTAEIESSEDTFSSAAPVADGASSPTSNTGVSSTNIQEFGVDEADLLKTNGRYIYSVKKVDSFTNTPDILIALPATESDLLPPEPQQASSDIIRIMDTQGSTGITEVKQLSDTESPWNITGLYLHEAEKRLIVLSSKKQNYYTNWFNSSYFANQKTDILFIDINNPSTATVETKLNFDGQLIDSRRNGDTLYLVLRHFPNYQYVNDQQLETSTNTDFLPRYRSGSTQSQLITTPNDCYLEEGQQGSADIITLVAINLKSASPEINSQCYVGSAEAIYVSQNALYLATTRWDYQAVDGIARYNNQITTDIHKFSYNGLDFNYRGSGQVDGHLGFRQDSKSFRFSEYDGLLRVVTFDEDQWAITNAIEPALESPSVSAPAVNSTATDNSAVDPTTEVIAKSPVSLSILKEDPSSRSLQLVSKLPNTNRPAPIGLPGEQLYASRFIGNRAYIVTFRVTDPLYVLNLDNPQDPKIAGELKIDGYSEYLHPISENLLLGVGKDSIPDGNGGLIGDGRGAWYQGVKLSLIDVTDPTNPREADKVILGKRGTESTALYTHHGLTGLKVNNSYRVSIPVELHSGSPQSGTSENNPWTYYNYTNTGLYRFEVDINNQRIMQIPAMIINNQHNPYSNNIYNDRSIMIDDDLFYLHNGSFWKQDWQGNSAVIGPK